MERSLLALVALALAGCGITGVNSTTIHVEGTVTTAATNQPVSGAQISLYPSVVSAVAGTTHTDAQGHYSLSGRVTNCVDGDLGLYVTVAASGFESEGENAFCRTDLQQINFSLSPPTTP
jgi:hypothetical protein